MLKAPWEPMTDLSVAMRRHNQAWDALDSATRQQHPYMFIFHEGGPMWRLYSRAVSAGSSILQQGSAGSALPLARLLQAYAIDRCALSQRLAASTEDEHQQDVPRGAAALS